MQLQIITSPEELQEVIGFALQKELGRLNLLNRTTQDNSMTDDILTIKEAAKFLDLSIHTIYGLVSRNNIPVNKRGKRLYFSHTELLAWIKEGRIKTLSELMVETDSYLALKR